METDATGMGEDSQQQQQQTMQGQAQDKSQTPQGLPQSPPVVAGGTSPPHPQQQQQQQQQLQLLQGPTASPRPAPGYRVVNTICEKRDDGPGPRCGHTLTAVAAVGEEGSPGYVGPRLILFGGATALEGNTGPVGPQGSPAGAGIRLAGATADVHCFDIHNTKWTRLIPVGDPPSPRAAHAATAVGTMIVVQGGIGPAGLSTEDLHVLDLTQAKPRWHRERSMAGRVVVQGPGPGPRYGHVMALVGQRFLVCTSGNDGKRPLADVWALDTAAKPYEWRKLDPEGDGPPPCIYATASARSDGLLLLSGGRDANSVPLDTAYGLAKHRDGRWEWAIAPGISPSSRYQHAAVFVNARLHVSGGALGGGRMVEDASSVAGQLSEFYGGDVYLRITFWGVGAAGLLSFPMIQGYAGVLLDSHLFLLRTQIVVRAQPQGTHTFHKTHKIGCQQMDDDGLEEKTWFCTGKDQYVLDTAAGVWCDRKGVVTSPRTGRYSNDASGGDAASELTRRCRHAAAALDDLVFVYGGLRGGVLLDDLLVAEDLAAAETTSSALHHAASVAASSPVSPPPSMSKQPEMEKPVESEASLTDKSVVMASPVGAPLNGDAIMDISTENALSHGHRSERKGIETLVEASAAEAEAISSALAKATAIHETNGKVDKQIPDQDAGPEATTLNGNQPTSTPSAALVPPPNKSSIAGISNYSTPTGVRLHHRAVVVAAESGGALGGLVRQLSIDQFENEGRRVSYGTPDSTSQARRLLDRQMSISGVQKRVLAYLLKPRGWKPPVKRHYFMDSSEIAELCDAAERLFTREPSVLQIRAPVKIFGDLHGQFGDLMRLFDEYGSPSTAGDITYIDYLFLGDYVDRGQHSLETITLLLALKIEYPMNIHLIRGNHEAADINALFGFRIECIERMGERDGIWVWQRINQLFNWLPLAAVIEKKIICMHGGIGRSINFVQQIEDLKRPITMEAGSVVLMDLLWSDPTENDSVEGLRPNARGPGLVTFGPDRVMEFCKNNDLQLIVRAHECVMDGFERFAQGHLITLFSATNYCGTANNAGAILVLGRDLVVVPKLIHPIPPAIPSPESSPERHHEEMWMQELNVQRPPTPTRGRPQQANDRSSLAWI